MSDTETTISVGSYIVSNRPEEYRLAMKSDGVAILQGAYLFGDGQGVHGYEWKDIPTIELPPVILSKADQPPYFTRLITTTEHTYNPNYGDDRICKCGHTYYRHFDSYEKMDAIGCKYCECRVFVEAKPKSVV